MVSIFSGITTLIQYKKLIETDPAATRPEHCVCCGRKKPRQHGHYLCSAWTNHSVEVYIQ